MEEEEDMPPFWLQTTDRRRRLRSQASSIFLNSGVLLVVLLVIAFVFVFIVVPSFVSLISQIFRPQLIKKSWDYLNFVLVLFAIICGFLGRNNNTNNSNSESTSYHNLSNVPQDPVQRSYPSTPANRWYDQFQDRPAYSSLNRLRSFSSYPDLRQESLWLTNDERWRFSDDTHLNSYRVSSSSDQLQDHRPQQQQQQQRQQEQEEDVGTKDVAVDITEKQVVYTPPPSPSSPPPEPSSPPAAPLSPQLPPRKDVRRKVKRTYQDLEHEKRKEDRDLEVEKFNEPPTPTAPPTPSMPTPVFSKNEKRRGKDFLISLRRRKKRQRQKSVENLEMLFDPQPSSSAFIPPPSPPPPPPPPPPPHFFQNLFSSKKGKSKKVNSVPPPPPPPPPPVTSSSRTRVSKIVSQNVTPSVESRESRTTTAQVAEVTTHNAPKAVKTGSSRRIEENMESGNASPLIPIPPPPPPPPFKMKSWKFARDGDYVRVASFDSSRSGSPDLDSEYPSDKESSPIARKDDGSNSTMPMFCPSPDVNTKAENFIAKFRAGLKLEKINSVKGRSNLGPGPDRVEGEGPS